MPRLQPGDLQTGTGTPKRGGSAKIGRGFLPLTDRHMTSMHILILPNKFSTNTASQMILKIVLVESIPVIISYTTKVQTPKPTPHLTISRYVVNTIMHYEIAGPFRNSPTGPYRSMAPFKVHPASLSHPTLQLSSHRMLPLLKTKR